MSCTVDEYINKAEYYLRTQEGDQRHKELVDTYNKYRPLPRGYACTYTDPWCALFVSSIAILTSSTDLIPPECSANNLLHNIQGAGALEIGNSASCNLEDVQRGDVVFYDWGGDSVADHVGVVVSRLNDGKSVKVIEGNVNDAVGYRYLYGHTNILSVLRPNWVSADKHSDADYERVMYAVINGDYGNGVGREERLTKEGYDYKRVQNMVNEKLKTYQANVYGSAFDNVAKDVIAGKYGNGALRRRALWAAGYDPDVIQKIVNQMLGT